MFRYLSFALAISLLWACNTSDNKESAASDPINDFALAFNVYAPDSTNQDNYEVITMNLDGSNKQNIINNPDVAWAYLGVKDKVLFISDRDTCYRCFYLYECSIDGSDLKQVTNFKLKDSWMGSRKDGSEIIVTPKEDSVFYIINREGSIIDRIDPALAYFNDPTFSPDGEYIVFRGATFPFKRDNGFVDELYIMKSDGSEKRQLTTYPKSDTTALWHNYHAGPPRWHPSGEFITYQSKQEGKYSLFAISPDGTNAFKLTDNSLSEGWHDWSPDGKFIAIELFNKDQEQFHIGLMDWDTKALSILTDSTYQYQQAPVFLEKK